MVECQWDSLVPSTYSPEVTCFGLSFMLALCVSLCFDCYWVFLICTSLVLVNWGSLHPPHLVFCCADVRQVLLKQIVLCVPGFEASLSLLFSCLFWVISPLFIVFPDQSWIEVSVASTPFFTFFRCYLLVVPFLVGFLFQQVYWCSPLPPCKFSGEAKWNLSHCLGD